MCARPGRGHEELVADDWLVDEFARTALWAVEMILAGATIAGVTALIKDKAAIANKLQATKVDISIPARAKFAQRQALRAGSARKIAATVREIEVAGTGLKVKVPVNESISQMAVSATRGKAPARTSGVKSKPQAPRIEKQLTPEELAGQNLKVIAKADKPVDAVKNKETLRANETRSSQLLPGEGEVGTYKDLLKEAKPGDNVTPDHIPYAAFMSKFGKKNIDGICMKIKHYHPGEGGRHRHTRSYGNTQNAESTLSPRSELATDIWDRKKIYQEDGLYDFTIRESLQNVIKQNKETLPDVFEKDKKLRLLKASSKL
jgi:hypothetical protein